MRRALLGAVCLLVASEVAVRLSGAVDFPLYSVDSEIGYVVKPDQSGTFLNKNRWVFNDRAMGTDQRWKPTEKMDVLLLGNSIVMGGKLYDQKDTLGSLMQVSLGDMVTVWPAAVGGWTNVNAGVYLRRNPDVVKGTDFFIWEYMNGGFSQLSADRGEYVWPTKEPFCAVCYLIRRYVLPRFFNFDTNELPPKGASQAENIVQFEKLVGELSAASSKKTPGIIFMYPSKDEYIGYKTGTDYAPDRKELERIAKQHNLLIVDVAQAPEWHVGLYREGTHPTVEGNKAIADILARSVQAALKL